MTRASPSRLNLIAPDLELAVDGHNAQACAQLAVVKALAANPNSDADVLGALAAIQRGDWAGARSFRAAVVAIADRLDDQYLSEYEAAGDSNTTEVLGSFARARALASLATSLETDEELAAKEALYEAHASLPDSISDDLLQDARDLIKLRRVEA